VTDKISLAEKFALLEQAYVPGIVGYMNDYKLQIVKIHGPFVWHKHDETDDFFLVIRGRLTIHLRDRDVNLEAGEIFVVPRGVEHCPDAEEETDMFARACAPTALACSVCPGPRRASGYVYRRCVATVVLVHGLFGAFGDERTWSRLVPHRVLVPDLLGYGEHAASAEQITMDAQVEHLRELLGPEPVYLVGHSVGGVIVTLYADRYPDDVLGLINVEGNFSLADAFWSAELARKAPSDAEALLAAHRDDPAGWFGGTTDPYEIESARAMLAFQPASTLQATAASVVAVTGAPTWEPLLRAVFARTAVHLVAGEASGAGWNVPDWAITAARTYTEVPGVGHAMMFQRPEIFGNTLASLIR